MLPSLPEEHIIGIDHFISNHDGVGGFLRNSPEDFQVYEEGVPQHITYFSSNPVPLSTVILIDQSLDPQARSKLNETLLALIESFSDFDEVALFKFDHTPDKVLDFTFDKKKILESFKTKLGGQSESPGILSGPFSAQTTIGGIP